MKLGPKPDLRALEQVTAPPILLDPGGVGVHPFGSKGDDPSGDGA